MEILAWIVLILCLLLSLLGTFLPVIPGSVLVLIGALVHKWVFPHMLSKWVIIGVGLIALLSWGIDFIGVMIGSRFGKGTKYGLTGAMIGALGGIFFPLGD